MRSRITPISVAPLPTQATNASMRAHETTTGPELRAACARIDAFVACVGSGATLIGVMRDLKRHDPTV
ncbi:MAG TPA: hypothetical protein VGN14_18135, partial [Candidatus Elarobacter sp.]